MRVQLLLTCLCDAFFGEVGIATVKVLRHAGCDVSFPEGQTCCGQPPYNAGCWEEARKIARRTIDAFSPESPIVAPSASCVAMLRYGAPRLGLSPPRVYELGEFLLSELGVSRWPLRGSTVATKQVVAYHRACHGRELGLEDTHERLLRLIPGLELRPLIQEEQCCGFGGAFSVTHPAISSGIGLEKLRCTEESGVATLVSGDMGCLMHLNGLARREHSKLRFRHYAELLAGAIA